MAQQALTYIDALTAIASRAKVAQFEVHAMPVDEEAMAFTGEQASAIVDWAMAPNDFKEEGAMYEVSAGDAHIGYIYVTDTVYYQTL